MGPGWIGAVRDQRSDDGRREAQMGHRVSRDEAPDPVRAREVRCSLVHDEPGAEQEGPGDRPRPHHPAEVGEPEERVALAKVERVGEILGALDRETAVDVDGALRPARRSGRVDQHVGRLGIGRGGCRGRDRPAIVRGVHRIVPVDVAAVRSREAPPPASRVVARRRRVRRSARRRPPRRRLSSGSPGCRGARIRRQ